MIVPSWKIGRPFQILLLIIIACLGWGVLWEPDQLRLVRDDLTIWQWDEAPLKIVVISDIHAGAPYMDAAKLEEVVQMANSAEPDIILLAGDYLVDRNIPGGEFVTPQDVARLLKPLRAPLGVYAVLGNHDWWSTPQDVHDAFESVGISVLCNETRRIQHKGNAFWLMGLGDMHTGKQDIAGAMEVVDDDRPIIAFTHIPDIFATFPGRIALGIAGHTHGGQVALPFIGPLLTNSEFGQRYAGGVVTEEGQTFFISKGIGTSILPIRFGVPPEINLLYIKGNVPN